MTWSKLLRAVVGLGVLASGVPGCGGDSKDAAEDLDTGLPPEKTLDSLTQAEAEQTCKRFYTALTERYPPATITQKLCTRFGVALTDSAALCNNFVDSCDEMPAIEINPDDCASADASQFDGCERTVADLETCSNDLLDFTGEFLNEFTCSDAGQMVDVSVTAQPASCSRLESECPGATLGLESLSE